MAFVMAYHPQNNALESAFSHLIHLPRSTTIMERFLRQDASNLASSASSQASDDPFLDVAAVLESPSVSSTPSQAPVLAVDGFPDYSFWTATEFRRFPGHIIHHNPSLERVWWWTYGFRLLDNRQDKPQTVWVCERCVRSQRRIQVHFKFVANTGKSIKAHLQKEHTITVCTPILPPTAC